MLNLLAEIVMWTVAAEVVVLAILLPFISDGR